MSAKFIKRVVVHPEFLLVLLTLDFHLSENEDTPSVECELNIKVPGESKWQSASQVQILKGHNKVRVEVLKPHS